MAIASFDLRAFATAINDERLLQGLSWNALARSVGVSTSTIRRYADANDAEADGVLAVVRWLGVTPEDFLTDAVTIGVRLPGSSDRVVRVDMDLVAAANGESQGAKGRSRTTIQRLVNAAQRSGQPIASLVRLSDV